MEPGVDFGDEDRSALRLVPGREQLRLALRGETDAPLHTRAAFLVEPVDDSRRRRDVSARGSAAGGDAIGGELGDPSVVPALIRTFGDFEHKVRKAAVVALGKIGSRKAVAGILGRLDDPNVRVRQEAIRVLSALVDARSVIPLLGKLNDPSREIRKAAVQTLAKLADPKSVPAIIRLLKDPAESVRVAAMKALGQFRYRLAAVALIDPSLDGKVDYVYAGDLLGNLWKFDFSGGFIFGASQLVFVGVIIHCVYKSRQAATGRVWEGARGLEWTLPSPAPYHTFDTPPKIDGTTIAHAEEAH